MSGVKRAVSLATHTPDEGGLLGWNTGRGRMKLWLIAAMSSAALAAGAAHAVTIPGTADPFLAGAPAGGTVNFDNGFTDTAPAQSPVGFAVTPGQTIVISDVTGAVNNVPGGGGPGPLGGSDVGSEPFTTTGFTELVSGYSSLPINSLIGVFTGTGPDVGTAFVVGNGGSFLAPAGATDFYLATVDGYQWNNNSGAFSALVAVPEPATWAMMLLGVGMIGAGLRLSKRQTALTAAA